MMKKLEVKYVDKFENHDRDYWIFSEWIFHGNVKIYFKKEEGTLLIQGKEPIPLTPSSQTIDQLIWTIEKYGFPPENLKVSGPNWDQTVNLEVKWVAQ